MITFLATLGITLLALAGLGIGLVFGRNPPAGSCGGLTCIPGTTCAACPRHQTEGDEHD
ncbi:MAG: hypothetical protein OEY05_10495 [Paracoccaceae bacterium]|nr:hypothetical protein [Paracoccaceae bacterium]MDH5530458.1 hypothetical protein [Paracoccaceae bacterium]